MCVMSMVFDHYEKLIPVDPFSQPWPPPVSPSVVSGTLSLNPFQIISEAEIAALRILISDFKTAVEAARTVDRLTQQADCEDPEKKKLEERVAKLEKQIEELISERQTKDSRHGEFLTLSLEKLIAESSKQDKNNQDKIVELEAYILFLEKRIVELDRYK